MRNRFFHSFFFSIILSFLGIAFVPAFLQVMGLNAKTYMEYVSWFFSIPRELGLFFTSCPMGESLCLWQFTLFLVFSFLFVWMLCHSIYSLFFFLNKRR